MNVPTLAIAIILLTDRGIIVSLMSSNVRHFGELIELINVHHAPSEIKVVSDGSPCNIRLFSDSLL